MIRVLWSEMMVLLLGCRIRTKRKVMMNSIKVDMEEVCIFCPFDGAGIPVLKLDLCLLGGSEY
jgi:hypothetical protein